MKGVVAGVVVAAVLAAPATASAPTLSGLQRQLTQVRNLLTAQTALTAKMTLAEGVQNDRITCDYAIQSDNLNMVWHTLNLLAQYDGLTAQPDFPRWDDQGACARLGVTRLR